MTIFTSPSEIIVWIGSTIIAREKVDLSTFDSSLSIMGRNAEAAFDNIESKFVSKVFLQDQNEYPDDDDDDDDDDEDPIDDPIEEPVKKGCASFGLSGNAFGSFMIFAVIMILTIRHKQKKRNF